MCSPICGDKRILGKEICDDENKGGCNSDCSSNQTDYWCEKLMDQETGFNYSNCTKIIPYSLEKFGGEVVIYVTLVGTNILNFIVNMNQIYAATSILFNSIECHLLV